MSLLEHLSSDAVKFGLLGLATVLFHYFFIRQRMAQETARMWAETGAGGEVENEVEGEQ